MKPFTSPILFGSLALLLSGASLADELSLEEVFHMAVASGDVKGLDAQVQSGVDVNVRNKAGDTALHVAVKSRLVELVPVLLKCGANPNLADKRGQTPLFRTTFNAMVQHYHYSGMYHERHNRIQEQLLQAGLVIDPMNPKPNPKPEDWMEQIRKTLGPPSTDANALTILKALLEAGAKPDLKDKQGFTPLDLAKAHGDYERLAKIMGLEANQLAGMEGASSIMHGGATYWVNVHGGYRSNEPLKMLGEEPCVDSTSATQKK